MRLQKRPGTRASIKLKSGSVLIFFSGQYGEDKKRKSGSFGLEIAGIAHVPLRDVHTGINLLSKIC